MSETPDLPPRLLAELRSIRGPDIVVPRSVDEAILSNGRGVIGRRLWHRRLLRWSGAGAAAAAVLLMGWRIGVVQQRSETHTLFQLTLRNDLNADGHVNILDAFFLARQIGKESRSDWDVNADGRVDQQDVQAVAAAAVRVGGAS